MTTIDRTMTRLRAVWVHFEPRDLLLIAALAMVAFSLMACAPSPNPGAAGASSPAAPSSDQARYVQEVGYAPGYAWDVVAAGYAVCGQLARGATPAEVIDSGTRYGLAGDLWTSDGVARVVSAAPILCPVPAAAAVRA